MPVQSQSIVFGEEKHHAHLQLAVKLSSHSGSDGVRVKD